MDRDVRDQIIRNILLRGETLLGEEKNLSAAGQCLHGDGRTGPGTICDCRKRGEDRIVLTELILPEERDQHPFLLLDLYSGEGGVESLHFLPE